jgi:hypothetical protein
MNKTPETTGNYVDEFADIELESKKTVTLKRKVAEQQQWVLTFTREGSRQRSPRR